MGLIRCLSVASFAGLDPFPMTAFFLPAYFRYRVLGPCVGLMAGLASFAQNWDATFKVSVCQPGEIRVMAMQADGKVVILGDFDRVGTVARPGLARLNANGSLDPAFQPPEGMAGLSRTAFVLSDGRVILGGSFPTGRPDPISGLEVREAFRRLNADGTLDDSFHPSVVTGPSGTVVGQAADQGSAFYSVVHFTSFHFGVMNISRDLFRIHGDSGASDYLVPFYDGDPYCVARMPDGSAVVGGEFQKTLAPGGGGFITRPHLARVLANGKVDDKFVPRFVGTSTVGVLALATTSDGRILVGGNFETVNEQPRPGIARIYSAGGLDLSFNPAVGSGVSVRSLLALPDGKVLVAGYFYDVNSSRVVRLNANGSVDATWVFPKTYGTQFNALASVSSGVLIGGHLKANGGGGSALLKVGVNGAVDAAFNPRVEQPGGIQSVAVQSGGQIVLGGAFTSVNGQPRTNLARLNPDGTLDTAFNKDAVRGGVSVVRVQPDNKLFLGGSFASIGNSQRRGLARLLADGSVDPGFFPQLISESVVHDLSPASDGGVVVCGDLGTSGTILRPAVLRFQTNAALDTSFQGPSLLAGFNLGRVDTVEALPNGRVLIGGSFDRVDGAARVGLARLLENGDLDPTLDAGPLLNPFLNVPAVYGVRATSDGRVFICGSFSSVGQRSRNGLAGLSSEGVLLEGFETGFLRTVSRNTLGVGAGGTVVAAESVGSDFQVFESNGAPRGLAGTVNGNITATAVTPGGAVLVAGDFSVTGIGNGIVRVLAQLKPPRITRAPEPAVVESGGTARFSVEVESPVPVTFQWFHEDQVLAGKNGSALEVPTAGRELAGRYRVTVQNPDGAVTSDEVRLVVLGGVRLEWNPKGAPADGLIRGRAPDGGVFAESELEYYGIEWAPDMIQWQPVGGTFRLEADGTCTFGGLLADSPWTQFYRVRRK